MVSRLLLEAMRTYVPFSKRITMPDFSWIQELPPSAWKMSVSGKTCISMTLHDAAVKSATSDADLIPQLIEWARSRRAAEFSLSWDQDRDPDGLLMVVRRVCPEALPNDDWRTHPPLAFRSRSLS